jgi:hypothetical protein
MEEAAVIIASIISLVALIVFFVMAHNINVIKKHLTGGESPISRYLSLAAEEKSIGNKDKAREYLLRAKHRVAQSSDSGVSVHGEWHKKSSVIEMIDARIRGLDGVSEIDRAQHAKKLQFAEGDLVVELATGKQMRIAEILPAGEYKCNVAGSPVCNLFLESEIMEFDKWVREVYKKR